MTPPLQAQCIDTPSPQLVIQRSLGQFLRSGSECVCVCTCAPVMAEGATDATPCGYPRTFSAELIRHCEDGCIPPEVFADARVLLDDKHRRRYVRINPRCEERVLDVGAEVVMRPETALQSALMDTRTWLSPEEGKVGDTLEAAVRAGTTATPPKAADGAGIPQWGIRCACGTVPRVIVLRLGLAALTGLPLASVEPVAWLPCGVFALPWSYAMGDSPLFHNGTLIAMDAASIAAVVALHPRKGDRVLDLCCAPGMKLGLLADAVTRGHTGGACSPLSAVSPPRTDGIAVGVDVNLSRLYMARSTLKKQQQQPKHHGHSTTGTQPSLPVCLFAGDGCRFSMGSAAAALNLTGSVVNVGTGLTTEEKRRLQRQHDTTTGWNRRRPTLKEALSSVPHEAESSPPPYVVYAPSCARTLLETWLQEKACGLQTTDSTAPLPQPQPLLFDRVLVDAECSHDGSVAHMQLDEQHENTADAVNDSASGKHVAWSAASTIQKGRGVDNEYRMHHMNLGISSDGVESNREKASLVSSQPLSSFHAGSSEKSTAEAPPSSSASLFALQSGLLDNGYRQLRPGGTLLYATCSYSYLQNEYVVRRFLERANAVAEKAEEGDACSTLTGCDAPRRVIAVLVPAFSYAHEEDERSVSRVAGDDGVAACIRVDSEAQRHDVQRLLDAHAFDYGTVQRGHARYASLEGLDRSVSSADEHVALGSRFWPRIFRSSFLYVAKIWKKPLDVAVSVKDGSGGMGYDK
ncbi:putative 16S rRNA methyltransferase RsmB/F [Leishmania naiffi]|uniref:16S rRNA methyltransferase RsmB/F n=1 Tax=Leishmania naiffi TaxID=5678 RepID=A0AAW3BJT2_9TRYP